MSPRHHLDEATVVSFAAGALSPEMRAVAATHMEGCAQCRESLAQAEHIGGALLGQQQAAPADAARGARLREAMLALLDAESAAEPPVRQEAAPTDPDALPRPLQPYFGRSWRGLRWRWMAPGVHMIRAARGSGDTLILLRIAPGKSMPLHSHQGTELTQILRGAYDDVLGHFGPGDVADLDNEIEHRPVTAPGAPCICVAALDAPLRFPGWLARKLQPLVGL
ncbi:MULTISPECIES: ChrR family anti-sigma-E factor [Rhodanobacter]|jgi:putative transcriptional regulator|uniref:Anti-ECFsigma factor, ChrR n=2 Tax=Rhodanobacter TaxID=75309 RepID=A0A1I4DLK2_9GAMM|nr:ChrR family anti-sigma-E factor [Rhodanobacter glycinis]SFK93257.1 anti-ECFsigma factor, ChrR [Rhodanobacter glycinis]